MNRQNKSVTPAGTITRTVFDVRDNLLGTYVGTNDAGATDADPTNRGAVPNNMLPVVLNVYDGGAGGGDNNLTQTTSKVDGNAANDRVTNFTNDFRGNRTVTSGALNYCQQVTYDNLDRPTQVDRYNGSVVAANLLARNVTAYDNLGSVYQTIMYAVDPSNGNVGNALKSNVWYDPAGNTLKDKPAGSSAWTKFTYDAVARQVWSYQGYSTATENYAEASTITTSIVFEQSQTHYDSAGNVVQTDSYQRFHTAATTGGHAQGALGGPSDTYRPARVSFVVMYPDGIGRTVNTADYGTAGDASSLTRPANCHARSDTVLVTSVIFNDRGEPFQTIDPAGTTDQTTLDNAARRTQFVQNLVSGGTGNDQNITVNWTYDNGGHLSGMHAINAATGEQITSYSYGVTVAGGSTINSNDALRVTTMPDGGTTVQQVNRQGEAIQMTDARGTVHQYTRDQLARLTLDAVITVGTNVDNAVLAIGLSYEVRSLLQKITSYASASGPGSTVVNEVENDYNDFWQLQQQYQEHSGAVNTSTSLSVQYGYADGSANTIRPTSVTYPNGNAVTFGYGTSGGKDDLLSRIDSIADGSDTVAAYNFLGLATPVIVNYPDPVVQYTLATGSGAGLYSNALDRFRRVIECLWQETSGSTPAALVNLGYGYDRASNRKWRADNVSKSLRRRSTSTSSIITTVSTGLPVWPVASSTARRRRASPARPSARRGRLTPPATGAVTRSSPAGPRRRSIRHARRTPRTRLPASRTPSAALGATRLRCGWQHDRDAATELSGQSLLCDVRRLAAPALPQRHQRPHARPRAGKPVRRPQLPHAPQHLFRRHAHRIARPLLQCRLADVGRVRFRDGGPPIRLGPSLHRRPRAPRPLGLRGYAQRASLRLAGRQLEHGRHLRPNRGGQGALRLHGLRRLPVPQRHFRQPQR